MVTISATEQLKSKLFKMDCKHFVHDFFMSRRRPSDQPGHKAAVACAVKSCRQSIGEGQWAEEEAFHP